jgi:magnesium transporter
MATTATLNTGATRAAAPSKAAAARMTGPVSQVMRDNFLSVTKGQNVEAALDTVKRSRLAAGLSSLVFVVGEKGSYEGFVRLSSLVRAHASDLVDGMIEGKDFAVRRELDQEQAARQLQMKDVALLPIVDGGNVLVGVLTFDDAMDVLEVETSDDIYYKAGVGDMFNTTDHVRSEKLTQGPIWYAVRVRILFLMVTLIGGLLVGGLIDTFEDVLGAVIALAIFIPLVMDMGGNVGTQSSTIFARGFALGHITMKGFARKHLLREASVGLTMAIGVAVIAGTVAYFWQGVPNDIPQLGIVVGVALFTSVFLASVLGFLLPWAMVKIGVDHAPGADPFITTIKDFSGLAVYFLMASWLIGIDY